MLKLDLESAQYRQNLKHLQSYDSLTGIKYYLTCQCLGRSEQPAKLVLPALLLALSGPASHSYFILCTIGPMAHMLWDN